MKKCSSCESELNESMFCKQSSAKDGLSYYCKICNSQKNKEYNQLHKEKNNLKRREDRINNPQKYREQDRISKLKHADKVKIRKQNYYQKNKERIQAKQRAYKFASPENHEKHKAYFRKYGLARRKNDINFKLAENFRKRIHKVIKCECKSLHSAEYIGCSIDDFKQYIQSKFKDGMTWDNYGPKGWHLDHIIPLASFDLTDLEQQKKALNYTNMQPLWWLDNLKKGSKLDYVV